MEHGRELLGRIVVSPGILGGKPVIRGRRLAAEHILGMLAAGDTTEEVLQAYDWLEAEIIRAVFAYAQRLVERGPGRSAGTDC